MMMFGTSINAGICQINSQHDKHIVNTPNSGFPFRAKKNAPKNVSVWFAVKGSNNSTCINYSLSDQTVQNPLQQKGPPKFVNSTSFVDTILFINEWITAFKSITFLV